MQSGIKEKDEKDKKKQDVKYPDYWDGNIYICGSILFTAVTIFIAHCLGI